MNENEQLNNLCKRPILRGIVPKWKMMDYSKVGDIVFNPEVYESLNNHFRFSLIFQLKNYLSNGVNPIEIIADAYHYEISRFKDTILDESGREPKRINITEVLSKAETERKQIIRAVENSHRIDLIYMDDELSGINIYVENERAKYLPNDKAHELYFRSIIHNFQNNPLHLKKNILDVLESWKIDVGRVGKQRNSERKKLILRLYPFYLFLKETTMKQSTRNDIYDFIIDLFGLDLIPADFQDLYTSSNNPQDKIAF